MKTIDKEQIIKGIERANPWWAANTGNTGSFNHLPKRMHFDRLYKLTTQNTPLRALVLMGPRRVGKTVLIYQLINQLIEDGKNPKKIMYLSLDNPLFRFSSLEDLLNWGIEWAGTSTNDVTIFFDEIQYIDTWEQQLKVLVDSYRHIKFVVTGSAAAVLHKKSKESGAGRFTDYLLPSLSFYEYIFIKSKMENTPSNTIDLARMNAHYLDYLNYGGFPESITSEQIRNQPELYIGQDILDKVLGRDLPSIYGITNPSELQKLFAALAYNTSNEISPESISKQSGVSKAEIGRYIQFFESSFLIRVIEKTDDTLKKFQRKTHFKIVLTNPSLRSAIFGKISSEDKDLEALAETAIFSQLIGPEGKYLPYKYARWNRGGSKGEVDLVHINLKGDVISALEIKWSDRFASGEEKPKSLIAFCLENKLNTAIMTSKTMFAETKFGDLKIEHLPTAVACFVIGMLNGLFDTVNHSFELYGKQMINSQISNKSAIEKISQDLKMSVSALNLLKDDLSNELSKTIPSIMQSLFVSKK